MDKLRRHIFLSFYFILSRAILILILISSFAAFAQQKEIKRDSLKINDSISGLAKYEYDSSKGEDVYDGNFSFQSVSPSRLKNFDYEALTYDGNYTSNVKTGDWKYSDKKMKEVDQRFVSGFRVGNLASGTENLVSGQFQNGKAAGKWQAIKRDYLESNVRDTLFIVESTFRSNQLVGSINAKSEFLNVQGYFNADGYFHGSWEIVHNRAEMTIKESRTYEAGIIKKYEIIIGDKTFDISYVGLDTTLSVDDEQWTDFSLKDGYFDILGLVDLDVEQSISSSIQTTINETHRKSNEFIKNSMLVFSFNSEIDIWNSLRGSEPLGLGKFKVRKFEYTSEEKEIVIKISENFEQIKKILQDFLENPKVKIGKPVHEKFNEVELIYNIYRNELSQLKKMVNVISSDAFQFIDRNEIYNKIWPKISFPIEVTYEYQSELVTKSHEFPKTPERQNFDLVKANLLIKNIKEDIKTMDSEVRKIFNEMEIEKSLSSDEEKLVEKKEKIESLFKSNSEEQSYNEFHKRYSEQVLKLTEETFNAYGNLKVDEKKRRIKSLLYCYDNLIEFYIFLKDLKSKTKRLDEAYTRTTFNPHMMVDMSERIKENIYKAFDDSLKPYLFDKLSNNFSCETVDSAMVDIKNVYQKMLDMSKRDTKEEEKELKRERDPEVILSVLELKLKY